MNNYTWYVFQIKDDDGGMYAFAERIHHSNDLTHYAKQAVTMNACDTKREAEKIAADWNNCYIKNGTANKWLMPEAV